MNRNEKTPNEITNVDAPMVDTETTIEKGGKGTSEVLCLTAAGGDHIVMIPKSSTSYEKVYYTGKVTKKDYLQTDARRNKTVKLPVSYDGKNYTTITELWPFLKAERGYKVLA